MSGIVKIEKGNCILLSLGYILWKSVKVNQYCNVSYSPSLHNHNSISHKSDDQFSLGYTTVKLHSLKSESDYKQYASIFTIDHRYLLGLTTTNIQFLQSSIPILYQKSF